LEKYLHKWIVFALKLIELWQNSQYETRKIKLKKNFLSNQFHKPLLKQLPRIVDMFFEIKNNNNNPHPTSSNDQKIIMSFFEEFTTIRIILCSHSFKYSSRSSMDQQETKDFKLINKENDENSKTTNINIPCINNVNINDITLKKDVSAFICLQPTTQIKKKT